MVARRDVGKSCLMQRKRKIFGKGGGKLEVEKDTYNRQKRASQKTQLTPARIPLYYWRMEVSVYLCAEWSSSVCVVQYSEPQYRIFTVCGCPPISGRKQVHVRETEQGRPLFDLLLHPHPLFSRIFLCSYLCSSSTFGTVHSQNGVEQGDCSIEGGDNHPSVCAAYLVHSTQHSSPSPEGGQV